MTTKPYRQRVYSEESRKKMSESHKGNKNALGKHKPFTRSRFKVVWITNDIEERHIKIGDEIPEGFHLGRHISDLHRQHLSESMTKTNKEKLKRIRNGE